MTQVLFYNDTRRRMVDLADRLGDLKLLLVGEGYSFDPAVNAMASIVGQEVYGSGWPQGGVDLTNTALSTVNTDEARLTADNIDVEAVGGALPTTPAFGAVLYDAASPEVALLFVDFEVASGDPGIQADEGAPFRLLWAPGGVAEWIAD